MAAALGLGYLDAEPFRLLRALVTAGIAWVLCWLLHSALPRTRREWVAVLGTGLPVLWMGAVIGVVATGLLYWLVRRVDVVTVTSVQFLVPAVYCSRASVPGNVVGPTRRLCGAHRGVTGSPPASPGVQAMRMYSLASSRLACSCSVRFFSPSR